MRNLRGKQNSGFTVVEMLAAVAIIVILLGVSMVSVVKYRDLLKLTELDNAAREIYMAAENRAVLLSGARRLSNQLGPEKPNSQFDYVSKTEATEDLLPTGSVDPALRDGDFYIVYDRKSGSVTDVFYAEKSMDSLMSSGFDKFYEDWAKDRSDRLKRKDEMLVGWYSGEAAQGGDSELDAPDEPVIRVIIENGEELTVRVEYEAPAPATVSPKLGNTDLTKTIPLPKDRLPGTVPPGVTVQDDGSMLVPAGTGSFTWVLDSLPKKDAQGEWRFKKLGSEVAPGGDFTVEAAIAPQDGKSFPETSASDANNSLFQEGSGSETAYIKYLRHLQNLDSGFSGVTGKTSAVQTAGIRCKDNETYGGYDFTPIYNAKLSSYDGRANKIWNLYVSGTKLTGENAHAGLFSRTETGTGAVGYTFKNIRLVNASVTAAEKCYAGALVGKSGEAKLQNCWVYWDTDETVTDLKAVLGSDAEGVGYNYQITGKYAGGLVGEATGHFEMKNCLAATLVRGEKSAGGLIGSYNGGKDTAITYSYADCYLTGGKEANAAGLVGTTENGKITLTNCYAAGYIMGGKQAAGLCLGGGKTETTNVYSVMRYPGRGSSGTFFLTEKQNGGDSFTNTCFLGKESDQVSGELKSTAYDKMTDRGGGGFAKTMGEAFEWKQGNGGGSLNSHPYNLREHLTLDAYSFPGLKNLPHYGDWGAEFKEPSLVYYEQYSDNTWGVSGGNARDLINSLSDNKTVLSDGYAVAFLRADLPAGAGKPKLTCTYFHYEYNDADEKWNWEKREEEPVAYEKLIETTWKNDEGSEAEYYMIPLPDELVNSEYARDCFYRYLKFDLNLGPGPGEDTGERSGEYFYNPHFAETVVPVVSSDGVEGGWTEENVTKRANQLAASMDEIKLRTPRHLYDLSRFEEYYTRRNVFRQILDLDYSAYTGYNDMVKGTPFEQQPTGSIGAPFAGTYNGDYHIIKNVVPKVSEASQRRYAGLFGYSAGTLRNIIYEMDPKHQVTAYLGSSAQSLYVGALAGGSSGMIDNCAVSGANLRAGASGVALYVGGLVGQNNGTIRGCAAESARLSANCFQYARIYIGGLMGENNASITTSYAVGRIDAEIDTTVSTARICGFVGWNRGDISNSYAAVDLRSSGDSEKVEAYGFCGMRDGNQSGNAYLDQGNFSYRGTAYAANYHRDGDKAGAVRYTELTAKGKAESLSMGTVWTGDKPASEAVFPYPTAVKDKDGANVHYGQWPEPMPLGEMGVFYWEKLVDAAGGGDPSYHMSALAVDPAKKTIVKQSTLSEAHNDGRVVTEYGYGYYMDKNVEEDVTFKESGIGYLTWCGETRANISKNGKVEAQYVNIAPNEDLKKISPIELAGSKGAAEALRQQTAEAEKYSFYCWTSFHEGGRPSWVKGDDMNSDRRKGTTRGLSIRDTGQDSVIDGSGTFTLTQTSGTETVSVEFGINPLFADSVSVRSDGGLTPEKGVPKGMPGSTEENPFKIRCGAQLQQINWMNGAWTDTSVGSSNASLTSFPYLNGLKNTKKFYWEQTHDIDWVAEGNTYKWPSANLAAGEKPRTGVFMGIAQTKTGESELLPGWFGGSYDGQNYTIKNLKIGKNGGEVWGNMDNNAYDPNCMGLFGAVKGATLRNIVLYAESGKSVVNVLGRKSDAAERDRWYAGGVLAGLALKGDDGTGAITNCAVAGYTIVDIAERTREQRLNDTDKPALPLEFVNGTRYVDMGGAIGGLVGMTDMDLTGCMAAVTIKLENTYDAQTGGSSGNWYVPLRVGGLVGSTTGNVTNCYTGGTMDLGNAKNEIYLGAMTGGVGMVTKGYYERKEVTISNCYSYMEFTGGKNARAVLKYARMNGTYGGTTKRENNYYLGDSWGSNIDTAEERSITYRQLANLEKIDGQPIYEKLNAGQTPAPYSPVTSKIGDLNVAGRFSYAPKDRKDLQGLDYPFPTVLTQTRVSDGMVFHVHYGGWKLSGIERGDGSRPIELDMFARRIDPETGTEIGTRTHTETLKLSEGVTGGTWSVEAGGGNIVKANITQDGVLTVEALKANDTPVTVAVKYTAGTVEYSIPITVYVTANVELRPGAVSIFPNDVVSVPLAAIGKDPDNPNAPDEDRPALNAAGLTAGGDGVRSLDASLEARLAEPEAPGEGQAPAPPAIELVSKEGLTENAKVNVTYTYTQDGYTTAEKTDQIDVVLLALPEGVWSKSEDGTTDSWVMDFKDRKVENLKAELADADSAPEGFTVSPNGTDTGTAVTLTKPADAQFPVEGVKLKVTLTMDGLEHTLTITVPKPAEPEAPEPGPGQGEEGAPLGSAEEKVEEQPGGVDPDSPAVPDGVHDGGGVGADVGSLQRGQDQEQPGGTAEVPDPVLGPDPDL